MIKAELQAPVIAHSTYMASHGCGVYTAILFCRPANRTSVLDVTVPKGCRNGTFWWNYPQGTIILNFPNTNSLSMSICLRDALGGDIFDVHDITNGQFIPMEIISGRRQHFDIDLTGNFHVLKSSLCKTATQK